MARSSHGRAQRGRRAPLGRRGRRGRTAGPWRTGTPIAGLRQDGVTAPRVVDGAIDGRSFLAWGEPFLAPTLNAGGFVALDDPSSHEAAGVRRASEARGARLRCLPPRSPGLNPIERIFSKITAHPRKTGARARRSPESARHRARHPPPVRVPQLPRPRRVRFHMNGKRSRRRKAGRRTCATGATPRNPRGPRIDGMGRGHGCAPRAEARSSCSGGGGEADPGFPYRGVARFGSSSVRGFRR